MSSERSPLMVRFAAFAMLIMTVTGCCTGVTWYWATQKEKTSERIHAEIEALRREPGKPDLLVFELRHVKGTTDGLYAVEIPPGWQSSPRWNHPDNPPHVFRLKEPIHLEAKPLELYGLSSGADQAKWIESHRRAATDSSYFFLPYGVKPALMGRLSLENALILLHEFDWTVSERLAHPGRLWMAGMVTPLTAALDLTPVILLVLLFRAWKRREPVLAARSDAAAGILHLLGFLVTALFIGATGRAELGWEVWGRLLRVTGEEVFTTGWLIWGRILVLVAAAILCIVYVRAGRGGPRSLRLAVACSSVALLCIPFGLDRFVDMEIVFVQGLSLLCSVAAVVFAVLAVLEGVRPWWVVVVTFIPMVLMCLLGVYWAILTALTFLIGPG